MPKAHRQGDNRFCGATTIVSGQSTVYVNGKLWAVEGDKETHERGDLICVGSKTVFIEGKAVITAVKDIAAPDILGHPTGPTNPASGSGDTFAYG